MIRRVFALSYYRMLDLSQTNRAALEQHGFISIIDGCGVRIFQEDSPRVITLFLDDICPAEAKLKLDDRDLTLFTEEHASRIIDFILAFNKSQTDDMLYVNCMAGISRSGAVVTFVRDLYDLDLAQFEQDNPGIGPNPHVLQLLEHCWSKYPD